MNLEKHEDELMESVVATARYTNSPISEVAAMPLSTFRRVGRALDKILTAENTPKKG